MPGIQLLQPPSADVLQPFLTTETSQFSAKKAKLITCSVHFFFLYGNRAPECVKPKVKHYCKEKWNQEVRIQLTLEEAASELQG